MATFPTTLPKPTQSDYQENRQSQLIRSQMDTGPAKIRRRFTANSAEYSVSWEFTGSQLSTFETFFNSTIDGGSVEFTWVQPRTDASVTARFVDGVYSVSSLGHDLYRVSSKLEVMP